LNQIYKLKMGSITKTQGPSDISLMRQHSYLLEQEDAPVNLKSDNQVNEIVDVLEVQHALPDSTPSVHESKLFGTWHTAYNR